MPGLLPLLFPALFLASLTPVVEADEAADVSHDDVFYDDVSHDDVFYDDVFYDMDPWSWVRVDVPDYPGAVATSLRGSLLSAPPAEDIPWRYEAPAELDSYFAWEAGDALQFESWHAAGFDGTGVKVAVFDPQWQYAEQYPDELGEYTTHDCYAHPRCTVPMDSLRPFSSYGEGVHGRACAEVIRDIAPGVELHLVVVGSLTTLENAVDWAVREGIDLISMSLSFYNESFYDGTGPVSELMGVLAEGDVLMVTSAGNSAYEHWMEEFKDTDLDSYHEFPSGSEYLPIYLDGGGSSRIYVSWDRYGYCGDTDLDVYVYDAQGVLVGRSEDRQDASKKACDPEESVSAYAAEAGWYYLQVRRAAGDPAVRFSVWARSGWINDYMAAGSVTDPATSPLAFAVGAVRADGYLQNGPEIFSSQGPTHGGDLKPDIAGPDGLTTAAYGTTAFYGTSASTPAVTGALALIMSRYPEMSPYEAAETLQAWALDPSPVWAEPDTTAGAGYARLPPLEPSEGGCGDRPLLLPVFFGLPLWGIRRKGLRRYEP